MNGIFLDDERIPTDVKWLMLPDINWTVINRAVDFKFFLAVEEKLDEYTYSFDHDIDSFDSSGNETTGYHCLQELIGRCLDLKLNIPICYFHSKNPIGINNMKLYYENVKKLKAEGFFDE